ncbi:LacI family DNA-binding transcriptional regulator [Brachybacterium sp. J144]|uniref:LacI family DNA-binding transcriptional regulator n=1 Tax=Brachybacterium sp. J144 TaxID=3116487 RepID=UPI002E75C8FB|nr:LacI family DNA-binding transcriptional regulator [Brachybacterium sp. J144]MEE1649719.1 LacI family DNA-binding transcriptional regulator [Brachybacterium sp. J144]
MTDQSTRGGRRATIIDVAALAGVSRQTVSRAINDMPGISGATRQRVLDAAEQLNYRPSRFGRGLVAAGPPTLGLLVDDLANAYFPEIARAVVRAATARGWNVLVVETATGDAAEIGRDLVHRVDALVGYGLPDRAGHEVPDRMPLVRLDVPAEGDAAGVLYATAEGFAALAAHLAATGTRTAAVLDSEHDGGGSVRARRLLEALDGSIAASILPIGPEPTVAARAAQQVDTALALDPLPEVLIGWNDAHALATLKALRVRGVDVPGRMRVVGIDGLALGTLLSPELTSIGVDIDLVAQHAVDLVDGMFEGRLPMSGEQVRRSVPYRLILRETA